MVESDKLEDSSLYTVKAYHELAIDPSKRVLLCKDDTALQFLVYILDSKSEDVVKTSLKVLLMFTENFELRPVLEKVFGLQQALQIIIKRKENQDIMIYSRKIFSRVFSHSKPLKDIHNTSSDPKPSGKSQKLIIERPSSYSNAVKAKIMVFQIFGLSNHEQRKMCEKQLLKVKGLISITFSMTSSRFIVRSKSDVKPESIAAAIAKTEILSAQQVLKNDDGGEILKSFGQENIKTTTIDKENSELPSYLSDDGSPDKERAVAKSRLSANKEGGWLNSAANFLSRSFYW